MWKMMKAAAFAVACVPAVAGAQDLDAMTPEELLPLAQAEGKVTVFSLSSRIARPLSLAIEAIWRGARASGAGPDAYLCAAACCRSAGGTVQDPASGTPAFDQGADV